MTAIFSFSEAWGAMSPHPSEVVTVWGDLKKDFCPWWWRSCRNCTILLEWLRGVPELLECLGSAALERLLLTTQIGWQQNTCSMSQYRHMDGMNMWHLQFEWLWQTEKLVDPVLIAMATCPIQIKKIVNWSTDQLNWFFPLWVLNELYSTKITPLSVKYFTF